MKVEELLDNIQWLEQNTDWLEVGKEVGLEKQIEIKAELLRAIKRIHKALEIMNGN